MAAGSSGGGSIRVLHITGVGPFSGAARSLYEALRAMPAGAIESYFITPQGTACDLYEEVSQDVIGARGVPRFDHTRYSYYRGIRWLVCLRELLHLPFFLAALVRARLRWRQFDVIHVNEFTEIIAGLLAKAVFGAPLIVHVRSLACTDRRLMRTRWLHRRLRRSADAVVAIDDNVRATLPADLAVDVIHNSLPLEAAVELSAPLRTRLTALRPGALKVGFVGNLLRVKGMVELIEAARLVRDAESDVQFIIVGGDTAPERGAYHWAVNRLGLVQSVAGGARELIEEKSLGEDFVLLGPVRAIQGVFPFMDVLAFPSHYDAPGRPVFEAALFGVPSIVAVREPQRDTLVDGETGIAIERPDPRLIADAILRCATDRAELSRMGANAQALAERNFSVGPNAAALLAVYQRVREGNARGN